MALNNIFRGVATAVGIMAGGGIGYGMGVVGTAAATIGKSASCGLEMVHDSRAHDPRTDDRALDCGADTLKIMVGGFLVSLTLGAIGGAAGGVAGWKAARRLEM